MRLDFLKMLNSKRISEHSLYILLLENAGSCEVDGLCHSNAFFGSISILCICKELIRNIAIVKRQRVNF